MATIGDLFSDVRYTVQDTSSDRYTDTDLVMMFNSALREARAKRPDLFLSMGLLNALPVYTSSDVGVAFPLDVAAWPAFQYYIAGRLEMADSTFADNQRAVVLMNKFVSQLLAVAS
jgi:hypothetical protein